MMVASRSLNGLNARPHRALMVRALTEPNRTSPEISPLATKRLFPSSVGAAINNGDTRASAAFPSSSSANAAQSARSSKVRAGSSSIA
jgi:hypothetical protein